MAKNVLLTGGSGFIGSYLTKVLIDNGFSVSVLSRSDRKNTDLITFYKWDLEHNYIDEEAVLKADYIVHLAGEGIVEKSWTTKRKKALLESRIQPIDLIYAVLKKNNKLLDAFISASAVGIYGAVTNEEICTEESPAENDFLGITCQKWEAASDKITSLGIRTVKIRTGIVLGRKDGFLKKLSPGFKAGFGTILGTGKQYLPWIHIEDLCNIYLKAIQDEQINGIYNATVLDNTSNETLSKTLANLYGYTIWLPKIPAFVLRLFLGEMSQVVLNGQRVSSEKIKQRGFKFRFKNLEAALSDCLS
ncbi:TIGR01777 family oxidoreductase [Flavobacterium sp. CF136]|uniref:TIGR01777 family oxidoreductase n=1 Tax=Flavobacterium sp. (strain CF136) TaxID=1144313 RepID=UPI000271C1F0|nr:TIGR01777 family oxidoreductase [Flavobacterium sp. CF136]EJL59808.1 TIGR01777 family protein [Flavobacterium sp. CF136]